ncbi:MAG: O-antigen ligase family protein [Candidatus Peribacteraceae bacterium]|nr:O-antigen ligase family protein [Candidatus Peribacteraceae bacterium]
MDSKTSQVRHPGLPLALLCGIVLGSVAFFPLHDAGFTLPKLLLFSAVAAGGMLWLALSPHVQALRVLTGTLAGKLLLAFFGVVLLSLLWSVAPVMSVLGTPPRFEGVLTHIVWLALALTGIGFVQSKRGEGQMLQAVIASNALIVLYGFVQFFLLDPLQPFWGDGTFLGRTFSLAGQPNVLGGFIVLTFPLLLTVALARKEGRSERQFLLALCTFNLAVLITTVSRSALLGLGAAFLFLLAFVPGVLQAYRKAKGAAMLLLGLVCFLLLLLVFIAFSQRFTAEGQGRSMRARSIIWSDTFSLILDHPQGIGLETLGIVYPQYRSASLLGVESLQAQVDRAHNKPLDLLASLGPLGLLTYYGLIVSLLALAVRGGRQKSDVHSGALGAGIFGYSITLLCGFEHALTGAFFWLLIGWLLGCAWKARKRKAAPRLLALRGAVLVLGFACICAGSIFTLWSLQRWRMQQAEEFFARGELVQSLALYEQAADIFPLDRTLLLRTAETALLAAEQAQSDVERSVFMSIAGSKLEALVVLTGGRDSYAFLLLAWRTALIPDVPLLRQLADEAKQRMPTTVDAYRILTHSFQLVGDTAAARQVQRELRELLPVFWRDRQGEARILWKENPWLADYME